MLRATLLTDHAIFRIAEPRLAVTTRTLLAVVLIAGSIAGAAVGAFAFDAPERLLGVLYTALKVPLLLLATAAITLPGFFVICTVLRLREDWPEALGAILRGQAAMACTLASLAPITLFVYASGISYRGALLWNVLTFTFAAMVAQAIMKRAYAPLIARNPLHRRMSVLWTVLYAFVGIQMGWTLRPFIGSPGAFPTFFREEPFTNAYVVVLKLLIP
ncbi:MAG: hypothetical protein HEQ23_02085 [Tepidisphaera sp.]